MKLSVVIPAYNEEESITETINQIEEALGKINIPHELLVVNDNSKDNTLQVLEQLAAKYPTDKAQYQLEKAAFYQEIMQLLEIT